MPSYCLNAVALGGTTFDPKTTVSLADLKAPEINEITLENLPEEKFICVRFSPPDNENITATTIYRAVTDSGYTGTLSYTKLNVNTSTTPTMLKTFSDSDLAEGKCYTYKIEFSSLGRKGSTTTKTIYFPVKPRLSFATDPGYSNGVVALKWAVDDDYKKYVNSAKLELYNNKGIHPTKGSYIFNSRVTGNDIPVIKFTCPSYWTGTATEAYSPRQTYHYYTHLSYCDAANKIEYYLDSNIQSVTVPAAQKVEAATQTVSQSPVSSNQVATGASASRNSSSTVSASAALDESSSASASDLTNYSSQENAKVGKSGYKAGSSLIFPVILIASAAAIMIAAVIAIVLNRQKICDLIKRKKSCKSRRKQ